MPDMARTIVSIETGTVDQINSGMATIQTSRNQAWQLADRTRLVADEREMPLGETVEPLSPGDAFVSIAALQRGDTVKFGASPYGNKVLVVYTGQPAGNAAQKRPPQLTT